MDKVNKWIESRPFLDELAALHNAVEAVLAKFDTEGSAPVGWDAAQAALDNGTPLLHTGLIPEERVTDIFTALTALHTDTALPQEFRDSCKIIHDAVRAEPGTASEIISTVFGQSEGAEVPDGTEAVVSMLVWAAVRGALRPDAAAMTEWLDEKGWQEATCPVCGGSADVAQLKKTSKGKIRYLVCGACHTKWHYKRLGCPHCGETDQHKLGLLEADEEPDMRLDVCESCKSYLKTYIGEGMDEVALHSWASAHLDAACNGMGYHRQGSFSEPE